MAIGFNQIKESEDGLDSFLMNTDILHKMRKSLILIRLAIPRIAVIENTPCQ